MNFASKLRGNSYLDALDLVVTPMVSHGEIKECNTTVLVPTFSPRQSLKTFKPCQSSRRNSRKTGSVFLFRMIPYFGKSATLRIHKSLQNRSDYQKPRDANGEQMMLMKILVKTDHCTLRPNTWEPQQGINGTSLYAKKAKLIHFQL